MEEQAEVFGKVVDTLERLRIPYMITGGFAVSFWGKPRATFDIDIVVEIKSQDISRLVQAFSDEFYIDAGMIQEALGGSRFFNIIHQATQIKTDFHLLKDDPYSRKRFERRRRVTILGHETSIVTAEDLILIKLLWYKESESARHFEDAQSIVVIQGDSLDIEYLQQWAERQGTKELFNTLLNG